ncbi:MAG: NYN domain-containing protein [Aquisalinus sp.]|nr:NYN domain-containing protein [Aquisalinus sp.]
MNWLGLDEDDKCAIFIDGANLYKTARTLGFDIDYKTLLSKTRNESRLIRAYYYTAMQEDRDQDYSPLRPLVDWLDYNGYTMVTKIAREFTDSQGKKRFKGSIDIELAVDLMTLSDSLDAAVIFTGNGDFRYAIEAVQAKGVKVTLVSTVKTSPPMAGDDIRRQADHFIDLVDLQSVIGRKGAPPRKDNAYEDDFEDEFED